MWLTFDIGNSAIKGGFFDGEQLTSTFRVPTDHGQTPAGWRLPLQTHLRSTQAERVGIASVVPALTDRVRNLVLEETGLHAEVIHHALNLPFHLSYETPHTLGTDRLAAAAAAWSCYGRAADPRAVVAIDAGTALTCEVIDRSGAYLGGIISAGPRLVQRSLSQGTAQLPEAPLELPEHPIGRSTRHALQSGILYGFIDSVAGMLRRIGGALEERPFVVATGGWSGLLATHIDGIDKLDPHLVLHGVRALMALNTPYRSL